MSKNIKRKSDQSIGFTEEEKAAMRERAFEIMKNSRKGKENSDESNENEVMESIRKMHEPDRSMAMRIHSIIMENAPSLSPRTWYGMPAYAIDDKVICFFQNSQKFKSRYSTLGFSDRAKLDNGPMWPTSYAIMVMDVSTEELIIDLLRRAIG